MPTRRGLTIIEILIVLGISSLMTGLFFPALRAARGSARSVVCLAMQGQLYQATMAYSLNDDEWLPGVNRTGLKYRGSIRAAQSLEGNTTPETPTSVFDWISPVMGSIAGLSPNRALRTQQIFEKLGCPEARRLNDRTFGFSNDLSSDFLPLMETEGIRQISYLAPAPFHYAGQGWSRTKYVRFPFRGPAIPPPRYLPRLEKIGAQPAGKVFVADGTRYQTAGGVLDFDVDPAPEYYGSFTSSTPIYAGSTAYGRGAWARGMDVSRGREGLGKNRRRLSYRHGGRINVVYFDGHGGSMSEVDSKTNAAAWYPGGSVFTGVRATPESLERHEIGSTLP